uniref:Myosin IXb n=1 Tax=Oncorhynchus kisutch TaxID=8019 RepID=A0A8C7J7L5_ONCKI
MSVSDGVTRTTSLDMDQLQQRQTVFLQIYPRLPQDIAACCTLQVSPRATTATVIQNAGATLGLDMTRHYALLEVRQDGGAERMLRHSEIPVERVLLWPPGARNQHPQEEGYYFILQAQGSGGDLGSGTGGSEVSSSEEYDDLCSLSTLTEDTILSALRQRFYKHNIYTYASGILVAINPFKFLPIYNPKYVKMYNDQPLGKLSPHIFAVADVAFHTMLKKQENQCVVISGESGSGKTQSANFLIHCLTALSQKGYSSGVERTILGAGPVLEAFGNAKTAQNNHSSRFGKFIQVNYLERESVFEEQREFSLLHPEDYAYLQQDFNLEDAEDLRREFKRLHQAMEMVGFLVPTKKQIFSVLSAILYLGNVTYSQSEDGQGLEAGPADVLYTLSDLLEVKQELLVEALTKRKLMMANNTVVLHYTLDEAVIARDSMAKSLYSSLFDWIVLHINHALLNRRDMEEAVSCLSIGILDIFGFEDFQTNSFEQFCINYSIEKVHYYFHQHIFTLEQEEYQAEGISWSPIDYKDNLGCIHLISQKPTGLFHILDEESNLSQSTDNTLLEKFKQLHHDNPYFVPTTVMEPAFIIQHFTGTIKYQIKDFREKNTDHMRPEIVSLLRSSQRAFMRQLIGSDPVAFFRWGILRSTIHIIAVFKEAGRRRAAAVYLHLSVFSPHRKTKGSKRKQLIPKNLMNSRSLKHIVGLTCHDLTPRSLLHPHPRKQPSSISAQFQTSLNRLLETVGRAEPFFIHCIRSNAEKTCGQYTGMLETVRIRKSGYNAKFTFKEFLEKFKVLLPKEATSAPKDITNLLQKMGLGQSTYQIGKTKVFLKERERQHLQDTLNKEVMRHIVILQRWFRACLIRRHFLCKKDAAIRIQRCWLAFRADNRCLAATVIQATWRGSQERTNYLRMRNSVKKMQALIRNKQGPNRLGIFSKFRRKRPTRNSQTNAYGMVTNENAPSGKGGTIIPPPTGNCSLCCPPRLCYDENNFSAFHILSLLYYHLVINGIISTTRPLSLYLSKHTRILTLPIATSTSSLYTGRRGNNSEGRGNTTIRISRATRVSEQWNASLEREITDTNELRHLDEFLGNQVGYLSGTHLPLGHMFSTYQVNIRQSCDLCGFYIWVMEKAYMCSACKLICHKKCLSKIITDCSTRCDDGEPGCLHFGVPVCVLTSKTYPIPMVLLMMLEHVEMNGLYTEGLYRKSGSASHARELHQLLEINPETATLENYSIHTVTGLVKRWFRELPDPLLTYRLYKDFLHAVELPEQSERLRAVYQKLDELPSANFKTLERLVFHLVRVAKEEEHNRMSANSLAIVFAPCILRSQDTTDPFLVMKDVSKTTTCVEILISEQFRRYTEKMKDITELEYAEALAVNQLKLKRQNTVRTVSLHRTPYCCHKISEKPSSELDAPHMDNLDPLDIDMESERNLIERIKSIKQEKGNVSSRT